MNIKIKGGIIQSILLIVYLTFEPVHYQLALASAGTILQISALKFIERQELLIDISQWLICIPMTLIVKNIGSALFIAVQLIYIAPSKTQLTRLSLVVLYPIINSFELYPLIITIISLVIYFTVFFLEKQTISKPLAKQQNIPEDFENQDGYNKLHKSLTQHIEEHETQNKNQFFEIFDHFPDGVAIVDFDENRVPSVEFCNQTGHTLLNANSENLLDSLKKLKNLRVMKKDDKDFDLPSNFTCKSQFPQFEQPTIGVVRRVMRASTQVHHQQQPSSEQFQAERLNFSKNPFEVALEQAILQIHKKDVQELLKKSDIRFDLHTVLYGCIQKGRKEIHLEVKLFISFIDQPKLIILIKDISYKKYIKIINQYTKAKSNQLNFVAHELRTPLGLVIQYLNLENKNDNIKIALLNCQYLYNFSNDLMDLAQIKVGKFNLNKTEFNLENLLSQVFELFRIHAKRNKINLIKDIGLDIPKNIFNDESRIKQILVNLIGNAFKFTSQGSITVKIEKIDQQSLILSVIDTGLGIKEENIQNLLKAFGKLEDDESKDYNKNGVGLGLLICNMISKQLSINSSGITVKSEYHKGSTFSFEIDYKLDFEKGGKNLNVPDSPQDDLSDREDMNNHFEGFVCVPIQQPSEQRVLSNQVFQYKDLLIVDDNTFCVDLVEKMFNGQGVSRIDCAINGQNALQLLERRAASHIYYKVIILDVEMPGMDGFSTAKRMKEYAEETINRIPVIVGVSGHGMNIKQSALDAGFTDYYEKPLNLKDIKEIMSKYLS